MKRGLVMEGGAMRGMFTCGVLDVLMEQGITFDGAAGISAGAVFGCNVKSGQIGRAIRYNKRYCHDARFGTVRSLLRTGDLYDAEFCYATIPDQLDLFDKKAFAENPMAFYVGATDVKTGRAVYHECRDGEARDVLWMRASASMPLVSRPVAVDGYLLLDGGIADPVPFLYMEHLGYDRNVYILTQPKGYVKERSGAMPLFRASLRDYPNVVRALERRHERYNRQMRLIDAREAAGEALVLRPGEALGIHRTEKSPEELERVYQLGRAEARRRLEEIRRYLEE